MCSSCLGIPKKNEGHQNCGLSKVTSYFMRYNKDPAVRGRWYCLISHGCSEEEAKARIQAAAAKKKREEDVLRKMERQKKKQRIEEKRLELDRVLAQQLHQTEMETTKKWLEQNPEVNVSALGLSEDLVLPTVAATPMTITAGSAAVQYNNSIVQNLK